MGKEIQVTPALCILHDSRAERHIRRCAPAMRQRCGSLGCGAGVRPGQRHVVPWSSSRSSWISETRSSGSIPRAGSPPRRRLPELLLPMAIMFHLQTTRDDGALPVEPATRGPGLSSLKSLNMDMTMIPQDHHHCDSNGDCAARLNRDRRLRVWLWTIWLDFKSLVLCSDVQV